MSKTRKSIDDEYDQFLEKIGKNVKKHRRRASLTQENFDDSGDLSIPYNAGVRRAQISLHKATYFAWVGMTLPAFITSQIW